MQQHFIVQSVIDFPKKKLSYTDTRSAFTVEERLEQTKQTLRSIRSFASHAKITLIELGLTDYKHAFDEFILNDSFSYHYSGKGPITARIVRSKYKGIGETLGMLQAIGKVRHNELCFKLSGRYELTERFQSVAWDNNFINVLDSGYGYSTRLYSFPGKYKVGMYALFILSIPLLLANVSIERVYKLLIPKHFIKRQLVLGLRGLIAVDRTYIEE